MSDYSRRHARLGQAADRELAALQARVTELEEQRDSLKREISARSQLLATLQASQQTRGKQLKLARVREEALKEQLRAAGVAPNEPPEDDWGSTYLGQKRVSRSRTAPSKATKGER